MHPGTNFICWVKSISYYKQSQVCWLTFLVGRLFARHDGPFFSPSVTPRTRTNAYLNGLASKHDVPMGKDSQLEITRISFIYISSRCMMKLPVPQLVQIKD